MRFCDSEFAIHNMAFQCSTDSLSRYFCARASYMQDWTWMKIAIASLVCRLTLGLSRSRLQQDSGCSLQHCCATTRDSSNQTDSIKVSMSKTGQVGNSGMASLSLGV